jgi:hypothetical protein
MRQGADSGRGKLGAGGRGNDDGMWMRWVPESFAEERAGNRRMLCAASDHVLGKSRETSTM